MLNPATQAAFVEHPGQRGGRPEIAMLRGVVFLALVGGAGFSAWTSFQDSSRNPLDWAIGEVHAMVTQSESDKPAEIASATTGAQPVAMHAATAIPEDRFTISKETLAAITCGPWDISDVGIEAILQEMIRRGWTPPSGAKALEASHVNGGIAEAIDPAAPVPAIPPAASTPLVSAEMQATVDAPPVDASSL
jgi:hypothetical protein